MAYSINKVILVGNVGNDPEVKTFQSGDKVINFSIATSESWKDKESGEQKSITEWHKIAIFNNALVEIADKFIKKGMKIYIEGQLQTRKWQDSSGNDRFSTEIVLQNFRGELLLLDRSNENSTFKDIDNQTGQSRDLTQDTKLKTPNNIENLDDDIPF